MDLTDRIEIMKLTKEALKDKTVWQSRGYALPEFDVEAVTQKTLEDPIWLHFGAGNIFRCFPAVAQQKLLNAGLSDRGIIVCETFDEEIIDKAYTPFDNMNITVMAKADGSMEKTVVASIVHSLKGGNTAELERIFTNPSLQMVSFTITEKGYTPNGAAIKIAAEMLYKRWKVNAAPLALVSMDNLAKNGDKLREAVTACVKPLVDEGAMDVDFLAYIGRVVSFPLGMIDKITPRPSEKVRDLLQADGIEAEIVCTKFNTYTSVFVNAESKEYLVIEDRFPNGRPPLEKAGVIFTDAETVDKVEKMKVGTCLNPLHTVIAVFGCLLGYETVWEAMTHKGLRCLVERIGYDEGLPVVVNPGIINPKQFIDDVLNERFPNSFIPDAPARIASDTSLKIPVRFGETLKTYAEKGNVSELEYIPVFIAGWLRYLLGINDKGEKFTPSPDPRLDELMGKLTGIKLGDKEGFAEKIKPILADESLFGIDLTKYGLAEKVTAHFGKMVSGVGMVDKVISE